jgi:hypothetical protein
MSGWQRIGVLISILWLIASPTYLLVTKNQAANKSYAACIESSLTTGTHLRYIGQNDQADAWERHSKDWCVGGAGYMSPVGLAHSLLEGSYRSAILWGVFLGPIALLWDNLSGDFALDVRRQFNSTIIALRSRGQNDELRIGKFCHRDPPLRWCGVVCRHHHSPTVAMQPAGQDPEARVVPGTVTLPLCSRANASPFWIMLLLVWRRSEHGMIPAAFLHL